METNYPTLDGQVMTSLSLQELFKAFASLGLTPRMGESCHYTGGHYLHFEQEEAELFFERIEKTEYLVDGDAPSVEELSTLAQAVSAALQALEIKHRFEIYAPNDEAELAGYFHHNWPLD
jgi:hypothetical protein